MQQGDLIIATANQEGVWATTNEMNVLVGAELYFSQAVQRMLAKLSCIVFFLPVNSKSNEAG